RLLAPSAMTSPRTGTAVPLLLGPGEPQGCEFSNGQEYSQANPPHGPMHAGVFPMSVAENRSSQKTADKVEFDWEDPLGFNDELTSDERMVRDSAHRFAQDRLFPGVIVTYRDEKFARAVIPEMGAMGMLGATIPEEYGGA